MEKLSGILPSNARLKSVDLSEAHPVRPGTPAAGRPVGTTSIKDRFTVNSAEKDFALKETLTYKNPKETARAKIAESITNRFFETRLEEPSKIDDFTTQDLGAEFSDLPEIDFTKPVVIADRESVE